MDKTARGHGQIAGTWTKEDRSRSPLNTLNPHCPSRQLVSFIGDKWTFSVLTAISQGGEARYTEIQRKVEGVSAKALTATLRKLEREGFVRRRVTATVPACVEYSLTELGMSLESEVLDPLRAWARRTIGEFK